MFGHRNGKGAVVIDGRHVADTAQCVHCGSHEEIVYGSGKRRGFCPNCNGFVCGQSECMSHCTPFEARIELSEALNTNTQKDITRILDKYGNIKPI